MSVQPYPEAVVLFPDIEFEDYVPCYRAILIGAKEQTVSMRRIAASADDEAIAQAMTLIAGHGVDLWDGGRFIEHYPAARPL